MMQVLSKVRMIFVVLLTIWIAPAFAEQNLDKSQNAQEIINGQFQAFRDRQHKTAFGFAAPHLQTLFGSTDRFIGMVKKGYGPIYNAKEWSFGRSRFDNGTVFQEVLVSGPDGRQWMALYEVRQQSDGSWRINGVQLVPSKAQST